MQDIINKHPFLKLYSKYVYHTEAPLIMHTWSAIAAVAATMGRHVYYPFAIKNIYANQFILLVGPPATKKSTAITLASGLLVDSTNVIFAPDDTGGQRQGLIADMEGALTDKDDMGKLADALENGTLGMEGIDDTPTVSPNTMDDAHVRYVKALEFGSFIGENATNMTRFLIRVWDGDDYTYKLKNSKCVLKNPLLTIGGATTTDEIAKCMPLEAVGQGFLSRFILVYAPKKHKDVPPSKTKLCPDAAQELKSILSWVSYTMSGPMSVTQKVDDFVDELYLKKTKSFDDNRFIYYYERRFTHVIKLAMCLAASRMSMKLEITDFELSDELLTYTEKFMPDALGEYGMNKLSSAKQQMVEFLITADRAVPISLVSQVMARDLDPREFGIAVHELLQSGKIIRCDMGSEPHLAAAQEGFLTAVDALR